MNRRPGLFGQAALRRGRQRRHHRAVAAGGRDGIDALRHHQPGQSGSAALAGVGRQDRRAGIAQRAGEDQRAAVAVLVADLLPPRQMKV